MEQKDHDMLIKLDSKLTSLCSTIKKLIDDNAQQHADNAQQHAAIIKSITTERVLTQKQLSRKTDTWIFRTVLAIIATVIMGMSYNINDNNKNITKIVSEFEDHSAFASIAWERFTGQPWGAVSRLELKIAKEKYQLERKNAKERELILKHVP